MYLLESGGKFNRFVNTAVTYADLLSPGVPEVPWHPHVSALQLALSQPGGHIIPPTCITTWHPQIFIPSYGPGLVGVGWRWGVKGHLMVFSSFTSAHIIKDLFKKMHKPPLSPFLTALKKHALRSV